MVYVKSTKFLNDTLSSLQIGGRKTWIPRPQKCNLNRGKSWRINLRTQQRIFTWSWTSCITSFVCQMSTDPFMFLYWECIGPICDGQYTWHGRLYLQNGHSFDHGQFRYIFLTPAFSSESRAHIDSDLLIIDVSTNHVFSTESSS